MNKLFLVAIMLVVSVLTGACSRAAFAVPPAMTIDQVGRASIAQLEADFASNESQAASTYLGHRYYFGQVRADQVIYSYFAVKSDFDYVQAGDVIFKPRMTSDMKGLIQGSIFEVTGDIEAYSDGKVIVGNCWFQLVSGGRTSGGY
jgi:hypothetical protein